MRVTTTWTHGALISLTLCAGACSVEKADDASAYREALPESTGVSLPGPQGASAKRSTQSLEGGTRWLATGGGTQVAEWYAFTRNTRDSVNLVTAEVLGWLWAVVRLPPSELGPNSANWGPYTDALDPVAWRLRVERLTDGSYSYRLEGRPRASQVEADFRAVLTGVGYARGDSRHGDGSFTIDLDASRALDPVKHPNDSGKVSITHDLPADFAVTGVALPRTISADVEPGGAAWLRVSTHAELDQTGTLDLDAHADTDESKATALEDITLASRWQPTGAGRADLTIAGGDLPPTIPVVTASECWDTSFARVYYVDSASVEPVFGDASACVYPAQSPDK